MGRLLGYLASFRPGAYREQYAAVWDALTKLEADVAWLRAREDRLTRAAARSDTVITTEYTRTGDRWVKESSA